MNNLADMSLDELETILQDARQELNLRIKNESKENINKLKKSGELKELKEKLKSIKKELLTKKVYELTLPITFTISSILYEDDLLLEVLDFGDDIHWKNFLPVTVTGKIGGNINKEGKKLLQNILDFELKDACEEVLKLFPEFVAQQNTIKKQFLSLIKEMNNLKITFEDL